jgi:hypothetical protein
MRTKKFLKSKKGAAEIVGTMMFLVILFFFFSNVFLWHNLVEREIGQVEANKMNSAVTIETVIEGTELELKVINHGGVDVTLTRLWIINTADNEHIFADLDLLNTAVVRVPAGLQKTIYLGNGPETLFSGEGVKAEPAGNDIRVQYVPPVIPPAKIVVFKIITEYGNSAACSYSFP